jgi:hypothetical protein
MNGLNPAWNQARLAQNGLGQLMAQQYFISFYLKPSSTNFYKLPVFLLLLLLVFYFYEETG